LAARWQDIWVGAKAGARNRGLVAAQGIELIPAGRFPHAQSTVAITAGEKDAIGAVRNSGDPVGVLGEFVKRRTSGCGINLEQFSRAAQCNGGLIRAYVRGEDLIVFLPNLSYLAAGDDIVQHDLSRLPAY